MSFVRQDTAAAKSKIHLLLAYVADLELEVDRLRGQARFVQLELRESLKTMRDLCTSSRDAGGPLARSSAADEVVTRLAALVRDLQEAGGYHPAHDQVIAIAVVPLIEQVFRWQQRFQNAPATALQLDLECDHVEWFPARLRHILDNLFSNALRFRDPEKTESWVRVSLRASPDAYELTVADNGVGLPERGSEHDFDLFYRAAPTRAVGLGVGLPVVKLLVEQSGGTLTSQSASGQGTTFRAVLPRYDIDDFLV